MKKKMMMYWAIFLICAACVALIFSFAVVYEVRWPTVTLAYPEDFTQEEIILYASNLTVDLSGCPYRVSVAIHPADVDEIIIWVDIYNSPEETTRYELFNYTQIDSLVIKTTELNDRVDVNTGDLPPICSRATFHLGGGDDVLYVVDNNPNIQPVLASWAVMIYCGSGNDTVVGTYGHDFIYGQGGNDRLDGRGGIDHIYGSPGDDWLYGGEGYDRLEGQGGNDFLNGGPGNDYLNGGPGDDCLYGSSGDDRINDGGPSNDLMFGGEGYDAYVNRFYNVSNEEFFW